MEDDPKEGEEECRVIPLKFDESRKGSRASSKGGSPKPSSNPSPPSTPSPTKRAAETEPPTPMASPSWPAAWESPEDLSESSTEIQKSSPQSADD